MISKIIRFILIIKNVYVLLLACITHLGCSSSYSYQMEPGSGDQLPASSSKRSRNTYEADSDNIKVKLMRHKIENFLKKEGEDLDGKK